MVFCDDNMIGQMNLDLLKQRPQAGGLVDIGAGWQTFPAGMVVRKHDIGGVVLQNCL